MAYIDIHSHILPNMDDGSGSLEQSLRMLGIARAEGVEGIFATPHHMPGKGCPSSEKVWEAVERLQISARRAGIRIAIYPGTEYYYREDVLDLMEAKECVTLGNSSCVLTEFDPLAEKNYIKNALRSILNLSYRPVLAHVERYVRVAGDLDTVEELRRMGVLIQVNAASVVGDNGRTARRDTRALLKWGLADFVATDAHSDGRRAPWMEKCAGVIYKKCGVEYGDELLFGNAEKFLLGNGER